MCFQWKLEATQSVFQSSVKGSRHYFKWSDKKNFAICRSPVTKRIDVALWLSSTFSSSKSGCFSWSGPTVPCRTISDGNGFVSFLYHISLFRGFESRFFRSRGIVRPAAWLYKRAGFCLLVARPPVSDVDESTLAFCRTSGIYRRAREHATIRRAINYRKITLIDRPPDVSLLLSLIWSIERPYTWL